MKRLVYKFLIVGLGLFTVSCDNDQDTTAPIIEDLHVSEEVSVGGELEIEAHFSDDVALSQAKIDIHDIFDGHDHGKVAVSWSETRIVGLEGKDQEIEESFTVVSNATAGPYHAVVQCTDAEGNTAEFKEVDFWVTRDDAPQFAITSPGEDQAFQVGDDLTFEGSITDNVGIEEVFLRIYAEEEHDGGNHEEDHDHGEELYDSEMDLGGVPTFDVSTWAPIAIPAEWLDGNKSDLLIEWSAKDDFGNISKTEIHIHLE